MTCPHPLDPDWGELHRQGRPELFAEAQTSGGSMTSPGSLGLGNVTDRYGFSVRTESAAEQFRVNASQHPSGLSLRVTGLNRCFSTVFSRAGVILDRRFDGGVVAGHVGGGGELVRGQPATALSEPILRHER